MTHFTYTPHNERASQVYGRESDHIAAAYQACGKTEPDYMGAFDATFDALPAEASAWDAIADLAVTGDPGEFFDAARDELERAAVAERLRQRRDQLRRSVQANAQPQRQRQARERLAPEFKKAAAALADSSKALDRAAPFDTARVLATNTSEQYNAATNALRVLSALARLDLASVREVNAGMNGDIAARRRAAQALASIVSLPDVGYVDHLGGRSANNYPRTTPLPGNATVEALCDAMAADPDATLLGVARGDFPGVSLSWEDSREAFATALASRTHPSGTYLGG